MIYGKMGHISNIYNRYNNNQFKTDVNDLEYFLFKFLFKYGFFYYF